MKEYIGPKIRLEIRGKHRFGGDEDQSGNRNRERYSNEKAK